MTEHNHEAMTHTEGLQDGCRRCEEYVQHPTHLDGVNLLRLWSGNFKTRLDVKAYDALYRAVVITQKLSEAVAWRDYDPALQSILEHDPHQKPDQYELFQFGGRR